MRFYSDFTKEEKENIDIEGMKAEVDEISHEQMCLMWRHHPTDAYSPYFDSTHPISEYFKERLFNHFGGFTPQISKQIGW